VNRIVVPSGENTGSAAKATPLVTWVAAPPAAGAVNTCVVLPLLMPSKVIVAPLGE
jgi:hypothetical protein